jgi:outer membrane protein insertion porin family
MHGGWTRDSRNSLIMTTEGSLKRVSAEVAAGDLEYFRLGYVHQFYLPLTSKYTLFFNGDLGYADGLGGKPLPFFKNYYAGGPGTVRGYRPYSLGPKDPDGNSLGGNRRMAGSVELLFPVPGAEQDKSLRLSLFLDGGQVYGEGQKISFSELRYSLGIGLSWISPFGPLRISFANPLNAVDGVDHAQRLQLNFGTGF